MTIPLEPGAGLAARIRELCVDLDYGAAEVLDLVTPTTRELLRCWFGQRATEARGTLNFSPAQREAILRLLVAHEVLVTKHLLDTHGQLAAAVQGLPLAVHGSPLAGEEPPAAAPPGQGYPRYRLGLPAWGCDVSVLAALLVWQLANRHAAERRQQVDDPRFAHRLLVAAPDAPTGELLLEALAGPSETHTAQGGRRFAHSLFARAGELLLPAPLRAPLLELLRQQSWREGPLALLSPASSARTAVPGEAPAAPSAAPGGTMVFQPMTSPPEPGHAGPWQTVFDAMARACHGRFAQIDLLCLAPARSPASALSESHPTPA